MIRIKNIRVYPEENIDVKYLASKKLRVDQNDIKDVTIHKMSIDARSKKMFAYVYDLDVTIDSENKYFSAKGELTLSHYCSHVLAVPTLQLEISRKYRSKESKNFSFMVNTLSRMIDDLNEEIIHHL